MKDEFYDEYEGDEGDNIYTEEGREEQLEDDEIDDIEQGFMQGYEQGDKLAKCALCRKILTDRYVEEEIDGEIHHFCCENHAELFIKKLQKEE